MATGPSGAQADDTAIVIQIRGQSPQMDLRKKWAVLFVIGEL